VPAKPNTPAAASRPQAYAMFALDGRIALGDIVANVNRSLRGWANYFHYRNSSLAMRKVRNHAEDRLRTHLMKRHKVKDRKAALCRFPRCDLDERYRLYKISGTAGWRSAHASA
jgi:RNA-directed DNA polymerase